MKEYRSALDRMRVMVNDRGERRWVEEFGHDGKPNIFYRYDSRGRLMRHERKVFGYVVSPAEFVRFGEAVNRVVPDLFRHE